MASPMPYSVVDDNDLDDAALWAVIDAATAAASVNSRNNSLAIRNHPNNYHLPSPPIKLQQKSSRNHPRASFDSSVSAEGEVVQEPWVFRPPRKIPRKTCSSSEFCQVSPMAVARTNVQQQQQRTPPVAVYSSPEKYLSPEIGRFSGSECSPVIYGRIHEKESSVHSLSGNFPSVSLFKEYQNAAMAILEKTDYTMISGHPFIKKTGWRKISFYFNLSYEIKDKTIEFDENRNVLRAEFVVRAYMQGGRFSDGWGSCERREKKFSKPNHDIPSTAETRAKNKACQPSVRIHQNNEPEEGYTSPIHQRSSGSFFQDKSKSLGSLIGVSSTMKLSRSTTRTPSEKLREEKKRLKPKPKPWLFSLCSNLTTDTVTATTNTPSLAHFLEAEKRATNTRRNHNVSTNDYSSVDYFTFSDSNLLFLNCLVAPHQSPAASGTKAASNGIRSIDTTELLGDGNGFGAPLLFPCLSGQHIE